MLVLLLLTGAQPYPKFLERGSLMVENPSANVTL